MKIITLKVGQLQTNCFLVFDKETKKGAIIDPGDDAGYITRTVSHENVTPTKIIATHGHFDHILAGFELQQNFKIPFLIHKKDEFLLPRMKSSARYFLGVDVGLPPPKVDGYLKENKVIKIGQAEFKIIATPGHSPGSIALHSNRFSLAFVGDLVFERGGVGRYDFSYSNYSDLQESIKKILKLPNKTKLYCGHGEPTTVAEVKKYLE